MDFEELVGVSFVGVIMGLLANEFFPILLSLIIENTSSLPLYMRVIFILFPLMLLVVPVVALFPSVESFIGGVIGVGFSIFVLESVGITEVVLIFVIVIAVIWMIYSRTN